MRLYVGRIIDDIASRIAHSSVGLQSDRNMAYLYEIILYAHE